jgi:hypothetical protein
MVRIDYKLTGGTGWAVCEVATDSQTLTIQNISYLTDALGELSQAILDVLGGEDVTKASFAIEPGEYRWIFNGHENRISIQILEFPDFFDYLEDESGKIVFACEIMKKELKDSIVTCLSNVIAAYSQEEYKQRWDLHEFPLETYTQIKALEIK